MMRILMSGFIPIWGVKKTPSGEIAKLWQTGDMPVPDGVQVRAVVLPQQFGLCTDIACAEISAFQPDAVVMMGATTKNDPIRLERFAINCEKSAMGDNTRIPVSDRPVMPGGPAAYESTLPIRHLLDRLSAREVSAKSSHHAGTHVCNSLFYGVLHHLATRPEPNKTVAGFIHMSFPNEFGIVEDDLWDTAAWPKLIQASVILVQELAAWFHSGSSVK